MIGATEMPQESLQECEKKFPETVPVLCTSLSGAGRNTKHYG
jgi:hypothetical protein